MSKERFIISLPLVKVYISKAALRSLNLYRSYGFGEWLKKTVSPQLPFVLIFMFFEYVKPPTWGLTK